MLDKCTVKSGMGQPLDRFRQALARRAFYRRLNLPLAVPVLRTFFINVSSKLKEVAASFGMTKAQLENLAKKMAQYYPCD